MLNSILRRKTVKERVQLMGEFVMRCLGLLHRVFNFAAPFWRILRGLVPSQC